MGLVFLGYNHTGWLMSYAVAFDDYSLGYNRNPAVMRLQTKIPVGSLTAVVGPNGAGKSTLLKGVVGSLPPLTGPGVAWQQQGYFLLATASRGGSIIPDFGS